MTSPIPPPATIYWSEMLGASISIHFPTGEVPRPGVAAVSNPLVRPQRMKMPTRFLRVPLISHSRVPLISHATLFLSSVVSLFLFLFLSPLPPLSLLPTLMMKTWRALQGGVHSSFRKRVIFCSFKFRHYLAADCYRVYWGAPKWETGENRRRRGKESSWEMLPPPY